MILSFVVIFFHKALLKKPNVPNFTKRMINKTDMPRSSVFSLCLSVSILPAGLCIKVVLKFSQCLVKTPFLHPRHPEVIQQFGSERK